jgi:hypothetical protein
MAGTRTGRLAHDHVHTQAGPRWMRRLGHAHASFYMGILHGVAGSSHFFGVLPALALPTRSAALVYIGAFGAGTIAAMTVFAAAVGAAGVRLRPGSAGHRRMMLTAAALALSVGAWWLVRGSYAISSVIRTPRFVSAADRLPSRRPSFAPRIGRKRRKSAPSHPV